MRFLLALALLAAFPVKSGESWEAFFSPFLGDLRSELDEAKRAGLKGVVLMYHFEACPYCKRMKDEVLLRKDVQEGYRHDFVALAIDTRGAQAVTGLDGRTLPESAFAREQKVRGTPTFDFYGADGERLYRHVGALFDPAEFLLLGRYVASGAHRTLTFAQYQRQLKGSWEKFFRPDGTLLARVPGDIPDWQTLLALGGWVASGEHARQAFDEFRAARGRGSAPLKLNVFEP